MINNIWHPNRMTAERPLVTICCITFNHALYVKKALDGFLEQRTDFKYEILIHDDCSLDGTQEILEEYNRLYPDTFQILYEDENQFSKGVNIAYSILLPRARGKYIAVCEGDDYWIDPRKLQIQVDFMEKHPGCTFTCHDGIKHNCSTGEEKVVRPFLKEGVISAEEMFYCFRNNPPTASFVLRTETIKRIPGEFMRMSAIDDVVRLYCFSQGMTYYFNRVMSYREYMHPGSWNSMMSRSAELVKDYTDKILTFYHQFDSFTKGQYTEYIETIQRRIGKRLIEVYEQAGKTEDEIVRARDNVERLMVKTGKKDE